MSSNNLDLFGGIWVFYGVVYIDVDNVIGIICGIIIDLFVVIFNFELLVFVVDNEDGIVMVIVEGGMFLYVYEWSDG